MNGSGDVAVVVTLGGTVQARRKARRAGGGSPEKGHIDLDLEGTHQI